MIYCGNCLDVMATFNENSIDSIVTDPPYGLSFMGKDWDHGVPGVLFWKEAIRVAKPGSFLLAFGGTRTFYRLAVAIEDAGWEIRDTVMWVYGSGFPKSLDIGKSIDKAAGVKRVVVGIRKVPGMARTNVEQGAQNRTKYEFPETSNEAITDAARQWEGWGTALKPAWEPIIVARKPVEGTVAENVLKYGTGGINIDECRVDIEENDNIYDKNPHTIGTIGEKGIYGKVKPKENSNIFFE